MDVGVIEQNPQGNPSMAGGAAHRMLVSPQAAGGVDERRAAEGRLEEIRQYHLDAYARRDVVHQTQTGAGQRVDWVPVEQQAHDGTVAEPPPLEHEPGEDPERRSLVAPHAFSGPDAEVGPPGTVPLLRKSVDGLLPVGDIQDYLNKGPRRPPIAPPDSPNPPAAGGVPDHKYAIASQFVTHYGTEGTINTWKPYVQWSNEFSLGQLWVLRGIGLQTQTLEVGAQTYKDLYGDWSPHLFVFYTTNGYAQMGHNIGGYNTDVKGWVQVGTSSFPGMRLAESVAGADQYDLLLKVQLFNGNWWVRVGAEWIGYYPATLYNAAGLAVGAERVDWGGEIVDDIATHPEPTSTWMGSGVLPAQGWTHAAYMRNLTYLSDSAGTTTPFNGVHSVTNPVGADIATDFTGAGGWGSYFYWGGPGGV